MHKLQKTGLFFLLITLPQVLSATDATWVGGVSSDLNTPGNWDGGVTPDGIATFNSASATSFSPTATGLFIIDSFYFSTSASAFTFTFSDIGILAFTGAGITGNKTDTTISFGTASDTIGAQMYFNTSTTTSIGNASLSFSNTGTLSDGLNNPGQFILADGDDLAVAPVKAGNNVTLNLVNSGTIEGTNEAGQIFMKGSFDTGASFTAGKNFFLDLTNSGVDTILEARSDVGQIAFDASYTTANFTVGDNSTFTFTNDNSATISSTNNNAGQFLSDGHRGVSAFKVGDSASVTFINNNGSAIQNTMNGDDAGQMVFDGNHGIASFTAGDYAAISLSNESSSTILSLGFDAGQIVLDGDGDTGGTNAASFTVGDYATLTLTNANGSFIQSGSDGNDAGQLVLDGDGSTASFTTGVSAGITLTNAGTISSYTNVGQIVVDGDSTSASLTIGDNGSLSVTNSGAISNSNTGYLAAQIAFNGTGSSSSLVTGTGVTITATNTSDGTISNDGGTAAQIYFSDATITGNPTITAINGYSSPGAIEGILFEGSSTAEDTNIALQNASLVINTTSTPFPIASLTGDDTSLVKLFNNFEIDTVSGVTSTFSGVIEDASGTNSLFIDGLGTQVLSGTNTFGGSVTLNGGTLVIDGSIAGAISTALGSTLQGSGTINGAAAIFGTLSPGDTSTPLSLNSTLVLESGSTTNITVTAAGDASEIDVASTTTINSNAILKLTPSSGSYASSTTYFLIEAPEGELTGEFDKLSYPPGYYFTVDYVTLSPYKYVKATLYPLTLNPANTFTGHAKVIVDYLNAINTLPALQTVLLKLFFLTEDELYAAMKSISPSRNSFTSYAAATTGFTFVNTFANRLANQRQLRSMRTQRPELVAMLTEWEDGLLVQANNNLPRGSAKTAAKKSDHYDVWLEGIGDFAHQDAMDQNPSFDMTTGGALLGFDYFEDAGQVGTAVGFSSSAISGEHGAGHGNVDTATAAVYGTAYFGNGYFELGLLGAYNYYSNTRHISFSGFNADAKSSHNGVQIVPHLAGGYDFSFSWGSVEPFAALDCAVLLQDGFSEHGAGILGMDEPGSTSEFLRGEIGVNVYESWMWAWGACILKEKLSYLNRKGFGLGTISGVTIPGASRSFTVETFKDDQNLISPSLELFFRGKGGVFFSLNYDGEFGSGYTSNEIMGTIGVFF